MLLKKCLEWWTAKRDVIPEIYWPEDDELCPPGCGEQATSWFRLPGPGHTPFSVGPGSMSEITTMDASTEFPSVTMAGFTF
jgi:hypothetical protein